MKIQQNALKTTLIIGMLLGLAGCVDDPYNYDAPYSEPHFATRSIPQDEPLSSYGNEREYVVEGKCYKVLHTAKNYTKVGIASWYGQKFHGHLTSTHERYDMFGMTAASPDLPLPTYARVTNLENGHSVVVRVNDRGPFKSNRVMDVSYAAAKKLGLVANGTAKVRIVALHKGEPETLDTLATRQILQVGSFAQKGNANQYSAKITQMTNLPVRVRLTMVNNTPVYRVEVGPFQDQASLDSTQKTLEQHGVRNITAHSSSGNIQA